MRHVHHDALRDVNIVQLRSDAHDVFHAASRDTDLPLVFCSDVDDLLQAVNIRGKGRDDNALVAVFKKLVEAVPYPAFRRGIARTLHVCGVGQQSQNALVSELAEPRQVDHAALNGGDVDLEVAGLDDGADRGFDRQRHRVGDAVVDVDELDLEAAELEPVARFFGEDLRVIQQVVLLQLQLNDGCGQRCGVDGNVQLTQHVRDSADVILMPMRNDHAADVIPVALQVRDVRNDHIHAVEALIRKAHTAVNQNDVFSILVDGQVFADFAQTAERNDFQF